uniref:LOW QUALITY PROTEIN: putative uncharacterized protein C6orf52 homolog n=1 Tax=Myodes glareolus TaxID=447135 RepID=UPI0020227C4F|nr:LOW QUALITY PROTEIN: putative uncharacterized protein C6orf52 homolog [Myodes glareolus]
MAKWEDAGGFGMAQQNNYYFTWQREQLRSHYSLDYHCDNSDEQPHSFYHLPCYGRDSTWKGTGPSPLPVYENPEPLAGPWATPEETSAPAGNEEEELLADPDLHLNIEESNKEFMAEKEELYDSLMSCHWQPLDTVLSNTPNEPHPTPNVKQVFTMPSS